MAPTRSRPKPTKSDNAKNQAQPSGGAIAEDVQISEANCDPDMIGGVHRSILEAFDNLNWRNNMTPEQKDSFTKHWLPSEEKPVSHALKLINSELARFVTKEIKLPPWPKDDEKIIFYLPGLKPNHQTIYPKKSVLTRREQEQLYNFYFTMTFKNRCPLNEEQLAKFQELRTKVAEEYAEFQEFAKSEWYKGQWKRVLAIPPQVDQFIDSLWRMRAGQCLTYYPDEYKSIKQIPVALHDPNQDYSVFEFVKHVHLQCAPPKMNLLKIRKPVTLISDFDQLVHIKPISGDVLLRPRPVTRPIPPVSVDHIVEKLLTQDDLDVDIVISMSGIKTLVDNIKFQQEWVLPVTVKDVLKDDGETVKRVVIIDKNLPPKSMSVHEKNIWHAKIVAKWMLVLNNNPNIFKNLQETPQTKSKKDSESYEDLLSDVVKKLNNENSPGKEEIDHEQSKDPQLLDSPEQLNRSESPEVRHDEEPECKEPMAKTRMGKNVETRGKGNSVVTCTNMLHGSLRSNDFSTLNENPNPNKKPRQPIKISLSPGNGQTEKTKPSHVSLGCWAGMNKLSTNPSEGKNTEMKRERERLISYDDPFSDVVEQDLEEFGVDPAPLRNRNAQTLNNTSEETASTSYFHNGSSTKKVKSPEKEDSSECLRTNNMSDSKFIPSFEKNITDPTAKRGRMWKPCVQYQLWNLRKSNYIQFLKSEQRSLNVLVRTRKDGKLFHYQDNTRLLDDVCVSSKVEFQPEYGASKMATSELIREYLDLYMRPNSKLIRVRSIGHTKEVMMTELKTMSDIKTALQVEVLQIQKLFDPLYAVLTKLIDLPVGRYMLHHTAKTGPFATLLLDTPGWTGFNLPQYCQEMSKTEVNAPPMPIDPLVLSPLQHRDRLAPALFTPVSGTEGRSYFSKPKKIKVIKKAKKIRKNNRKREKKENPPQSDEGLNTKDDLLDNAENLGIYNLWPPLGNAGY